MPDNSGTSLKVTTAVVRAIQEAALEKPVCPIAAYSYDLHVEGAIQDSKQVAQMTLDDCCQVQEANPVLIILMAKLREVTLEQDWSKMTDSPKLSQYRREQNNLVLKRVSCTDKPGLGNQRGPSFQLFFLLPRGRLLSEDAMMRLAIWVWSTCLISCMTGYFGLVWLHRQRST